MPNKTNVSPITEGALLSVPANVIVAFFAGPYAALVMAPINSHRLGRARRDLWLYLVLALAWTAYLLMLCANGGIGVPSHNEILLGTQGYRSASRAMGLTFCFVLYLRLRAGYLAQSARARPWSDGIFASALSALVSILVAKAGLALFAP